MAKLPDPFALLVDPSAALAAHDARPEGRVVEKLGPRDADWEPADPARQRRQEAFRQRIRAEAAAMGMGWRQYIRSRARA